MRRRQMPFVVPLVLFAAIPSLAAPARAASPKVAALSPQIRPSPAPEMRDRFHDAVVRGLGKSSGAMSAADVRLKLAAQADLIECVGETCASRAAAALKVDRVVTTEIEDVGKTYSIRVNAYDASGASLGATVEERCEICTIKEAQKSVEKAAERVVPLLKEKPPLVAAAPPARAEEEGPGSLRDSAAPAPAVVTPVPVAAAQAKKDKDSRRDAKADKREEKPALALVPVEPAPLPAPAQPIERKPAPLKAIGIAALAVAGASLVPMAVFSYYGARENDPSCDDMVNPERNCPRVFKGNIGPAVGFGVVAAALGATGATLLYLDHKRSHPSTPKISVFPTLDGIAASAVGEF